MDGALHLEPQFSFCLPSPNELLGPRVVIGLGDPIVDVVARLEELGDGIEAGGCLPVTQEEMAALLALPEVQRSMQRVPGGSTANVLKGLAGLAQGSLSVRFMGMLGQDAAAAEYRQKLESTGVNCSLLLQASSGSATASCLCLVTPDGQRTMRTYLGAALELRSASQLPLDQLVMARPSLLHAEGYCLYRSEVAEAAMRSAKAAGSRVSLDLASFEVVRSCFAALSSLLEQHLVDLVFMNEDEAEALCEAAGLVVDENDTTYPASPPRHHEHPPLDPHQLEQRRPEEWARQQAEEAARERRAQAVVHAAQRFLLSSGGVSAVVTSMGRRGCVARSAVGAEGKSPAFTGVKVVDTVGAGDHFTAGFLYAWLRGGALQTCCTCGCAAGAAAVQATGAELSKQQLTSLRRTIAEELEQDMATRQRAAGAQLAAF